MVNFLKNGIFTALLTVMCLGLSSCLDDDGITDVVTATFNFESGVEGWEPGFTDFPLGSEVDTTFRARLEPNPIVQLSETYFVKGLDSNQDLFIFIKRRVGGMVPNTAYNVSIDVSFISENLNPEGVPALSDTVTLKLGVTTEEPVIVTDEDGDVLGYPARVMSIDKGNGTEGGNDMIAEGNILLPAPQEFSDLIQLRSNTRFQVVSDDFGFAWVIIGTDSSSGAEFGIYYDFINVEMLSVEPLQF